jgi:hypothetical protein
MASRLSSSGLSRLLQWKNVYREADLYKAAVRVYTKPLFQWRKAPGQRESGTVSRQMPED